MTALRHTAALLVAIAGTALLVLGSGVPYVDEAGDHALIRLSWRAVGERIQECRVPTEEELAALPPHMRRQEICEGRMTPFELTVVIDDLRVLEERIHPAGAHRDRPVYVLREFPVPPGEHRLRVRFASELPEGVDRADRAPLLLDEMLDLAPRTVTLVTHDEKAAQLLLVPPPPRSASKGGH